MEYICTITHGKRKETWLGCMKQRSSGAEPAFTSLPAATGMEITYVSRITIWEANYLHIRIFFGIRNNYPDYSDCIVVVLRHKCAVAEETAHLHQRFVEKQYAVHVGGNSLPDSLSIKKSLI